MAFCGKCGTQIEAGTKFCPGCGSQLQAPAAPVEQAPAAPAAPVQQAPATPAAPAQQAPAAPTFQPPVVPPVAPQQAAPEQKNDFAGKFAELNNTADTTSEFDPADIESNKIMALISYIGILVLIPIFAAKESKYARFHANQGLVLLIASAAYSIAYSIVAAILGAINLSFIASLLGLVSIAFPVLAVLGIINAVKGIAKELPIIGKFKILK